MLRNKLRRRLVDRSMHGGDDVGIRFVLIMAFSGAGIGDSDWDPAARAVVSVPSATVSGALVFFESRISNPESQFLERACPSSRAY